MILSIETTKQLIDCHLITQAAFASQNLEDLAIYDAAGDQCCECGKSMTLAGHYVAYLCCTKCRYEDQGGCCSLSEYIKIATYLVIQVQQLLRKGNVLACVNLPPCHQHHPCLHPWHPPHPRAGDALRLWLCHNIW